MQNNFLIHFKISKQNGFINYKLLEAGHIALVLSLHCETAVSHLYYFAFCDLLNSPALSSCLTINKTAREQNPEVCDATDDDSSTTAG